MSCTGSRAASASARTTSRSSTRFSTRRRRWHVVEPKVSGTSVPRVDGLAKVTGSARYAVDLSLPGAAHGVAVRSDRAHARIVSIDAAAAEAVTGVLAVVTAQNVSPIDVRFGHISRDHPALAVDKVLY